MTDNVLIGEEITRVLGISSYDELYDRLNFSVLQKQLKGRFKTLFKSQTLTFVRLCYPEWAVCSWKFKSPLKHQWDDKENCRVAIEYIAQQEGWTTRMDYHKLSNQIINAYIGAGLMDRYQGKVWDLLMELYPPSDPENKMAEDYWYPWMMGNRDGEDDGEDEEKKDDGCKRKRGTPKGTFEGKEGRRWYVEWLCKQCNLSIPDDLSKLTQNHFDKNYGKGMIVKYYNTSVYKCLLDLFPEYATTHLEWFMMVQKPKKSFKKMDERIRAMMYVRQTLGLTVAEDFYDLSITDFEELNLRGLIYHSETFETREHAETGFAKTIQKLNPDLRFDLSRFNRHKTERMVEKYFQERGYTVVTQYNIWETKYGGTFRFDIVLPDLNLIIEIDGDQHFKGRLTFFQGIGHELILKRDVFKMQEAKRKGMSVLRISQMECWKGRESWITNHLLPHIKRYPEPSTIFIETTSEFTDAYSEHKLLLPITLSEEDILNARRTRLPSEQP